MVYKLHTKIALSLVAVVSILSVGFSARVHAQMGIEAGAYLEIDPQYPRPGDEVRVSFKTSSLDMSVAQITWTVGGETVLQGYGEKQYSFIAGGAGDVVGIQVRAVAPSGTALNVQKVVRISDVSFAWEGRTYTPPFFSGRPLVAPGAGLAIVAFPTVFDTAGKQYGASDLVYEWMINSGVGNKIIGKGKNSVVLTPNKPFDDYGVTLTVKDPAGETRLIEFVRVPKNAPRILFYKDDPILGIRYAHGLEGTASLEEEEMNLVAEPFYTSAKNRVDPILSYAWNVDGQKLDTPGSLLLRPEGEGIGTALISLTIVNSDFILQRFQQRLNIDFSSAGGVDQTNPSTTPL